MRSFLESGHDNRGFREEESRAVLRSIPRPHTAMDAHHGTRDTTRETKAAKTYCSTPGRGNRFPHNQESSGGSRRPRWTPVTDDDKTDPFSLDRQTHNVKRMPASNLRRADD